MAAAGLDRSTPRYHPPSGVGKPGIPRGSWRAAYARVEPRGRWFKRPGGCPRYHLLTACQLPLNAASIRAETLPPAALLLLVKLPRYDGPYPYVRAP